MTACLDAWAILAWLDGEEPAQARVQASIGARPIVSWINLVEVYYRIERDHGRGQADEMLIALRKALWADLPGAGRMLAAARLKARARGLLCGCDRRGARLRPADR